MPLPLVHIIGTYPGCGATTITHLWGESADERPLDSVSYTHLTLPTKA